MRLGAICKCKISYLYSLQKINFALLFLKACPIRRIRLTSIDLFHCPGKNKELFLKRYGAGHRVFGDLFPQNDSIGAAILNREGWGRR
jgi:hypothetical protein